MFFNAQRRLMGRIIIPKDQFSLTVMVLISITELFKLVFCIDILLDNQYSPVNKPDFSTDKRLFANSDFFSFLLVSSRKSTDSANP